MLTKEYLNRIQQSFVGCKSDVEEIRATFSVLFKTFLSQSKIKQDALMMKVM